MSFPSEWKRCCSIFHGVETVPFPTPLVSFMDATVMVEHMQRSPLKFLQVNIHCNTPVLGLNTLNTLQAYPIQTYPDFAKGFPQSCDQAATIGSLRDATRLFRVSGTNRWIN